MKERAIRMQQLSPRATSNMQYQPHTAMQHQSPPEPYRNIQDNYQGNMDADMYLEPSNNNNNSYMRQKPLQRNIHENDSGMYISLGLIWHKYQSLCNHELSVVFWRCLPVSSCVVVEICGQFWLKLWSVDHHVLHMHQWPMSLVHVISICQNAKWA